MAHMQGKLGAGGHVGHIYRSASALSGYMDKLEVQFSADAPYPPTHAELLC